MDDNGPLTGVLPKLEVFAPARLAPRPRPSVDSSSVPNASGAAPNVPDSNNSSTLEFGAAEDLSSGVNDTLWTAMMALPSWLVSFIVHLVLLLVLATCTYVAQHEGPIFLELAQTPSSSEPSVMEISIEDPALDDPFESLESEDEEDLIAETELPPIDLEEQASLPEIYETADPFLVTELPEFWSEPVVPVKTASQKEGDGGTEFFGTRSYGSEFVFVIDCSDSMSADYRWDRAVTELVATLDQFDDKQKFLVMLYNDRNFMMFGAPSDQKLIPATAENKRRISEWLGAAMPFAGTRPASSVRLALRKKPDAIYFLSDGELRDNTMFGLRQWNEPRKGPDGIKRLTPIHTILLGSNFGRRTMRTIAEENNGIFTHVR